MSEFQQEPRARIEQLLAGMVVAEASDLHIVPGHPPVYRVHGELKSVPNAEEIGAEAAAAMIASVVPDALKERYSTALNLDFSLELEVATRLERYRANTFRAHGVRCACFRHIPEQIPSFEWMGFPLHLAEDIVSLTNGLVIVTGITGSGKSTTLAGLVNTLNDRGGYRIITVEEPIEYIYPRRDRSLVTQREVGLDCGAFHEGLKYGLRQDPDVILVGEIRDRETAQMALSAAETGHLILTTMHTKDAKGAISRFVDLFEHNAHDDIRSQLALSLRYVIAQHLLPGPTRGQKRALALETMLVNTPVRAGIKLGKLESIESAIQTGKADGMIRLDDSLQALLAQGRISFETARRYAKNPGALQASPHVVGRTV
jgi:twitching motility protein PilT